MSEEELSEQRSSFESWIVAQFKVEKTQLARGEDGSYIGPDLLDAMFIAFCAGWELSHER